MKRAVLLCVAVLLVPGMLRAQVIVDDSWVDGGRNNGGDALDTDWWYSTASAAIEVSPGLLGLVSGTSGRGIHGTFTSQSLAVGETLTATFTFSTPATVVGAPGTTTSFRAGFFDTTGHPGLPADISASTGTPNPVYNNLLGYMFDWDVNSAANNTQFRERSNMGSGLLLAATADYSNLSSGGNNYNFAANTTYVGVLSVTRTDPTTLSLTSTLSQGASVLTTYTATDSSASTTTFGMLAFHVNANTFGSVNTVNSPDNGLDFTNIKIEFTPIPEPSGFALAALGALSVLWARRRVRD